MSSLNIKPIFFYFSRKNIALKHELCEEICVKIKGLVRLLNYSDETLYV